MNVSLYQFTLEQRKNYENLPAALCFFQVSGDRFRLLLASDGICALLGINRERLMQSGNDGLLPLVYWEDRAAVLNAHSLYAASPDLGYRSVFRICRPDVGLRWLSCHGRGQKLDDGSTLLCCQYADITDDSLLSDQLKAEKNRRELLLGEIINSAGAAVFWKDAKRRFLGANTTFLNAYGLSAEQLIGKTDLEAGLLVDNEQFRDDELFVLREGKAIHGKKTVCSTHEGLRNIIADKDPIVRDGKVIGLIGSFIDVTREHQQHDEINRLNDELQRRVCEFDMLINATRVCISKVRLADMTIVENNDAVFQTIGMKREEYDRSCAGNIGLFFKDYRQDYLSLIEALDRALRDGKTGFSIVMRMPTKNDFVWVNSVNTFSDYVDGKPTNMFAVYTDITEAIRDKERLKEADSQAEQNRQLRELIDNLPAGVAVTRLRGNTRIYDSLNSYMFEKYGINQAGIEAAGNDGIAGFVYPQDREMVRQHQLDFYAASNGAEENLSFRLCLPDGSPHWVELKGKMVDHGDDIRTVYFVYTDIDEMKKTEAALRDSRRQYEGTVSAAGLVMWEYDIPGRRYLITNTPAADKLSQKYQDNRILENVPESLLPDIEESDWPKVMEMFRQIHAGHDASCVVWMKQHNDKERHCLRVMFTVVCDESGRAIKAYGAQQNITAEKKAEERYQHELQVLKENKSANLISKEHCNLTQNSILEYIPILPEARRLDSTMTYDESCGSFLRLLYNDEERTRAAKVVLRENLLRRFLQGESQSTLVTRRMGMHGTPVWVSDTINTYAMPNSDVECFIYSYDITEKVIEEQIIAKLSSLNYDDIGFIYADSGRCTLYRPSGSGTLRASAIDYKDALNQFLEDGMPPELRKATVRALDLPTLRKNLMTNELFSYSCQLTDRNSNDIYKLLQFSYLDDNHDTIFLCVSDITRQYREEHEQITRLQAAKLEADRANEAKSLFLSSMSHDLRTPLNGIIGFTDIAMKENDPAQKQIYLAKIKSSGNLLRDLVDDTLELSRIESGKLTLEAEPANLRELCDAVVTAMKPAAELKRLRVKAEVESFPNVTIRVDRLKLQKVILNLLSNAVKYTPNGGTVSLFVTLLQPPVNGCSYRFVVEDTGIGMKPDFLPRAFEAFSQEKRAEAGSVTGTGLGLTIVKRVVDLMGGSVSVQSTVGFGTTFTVELPLHRIDDVPDDQKTKVAGKSLTGKKILLCEDNSLNAEIATILLKEQGMTVEWARDGREGVEKFLYFPAGHYDAILMDIRMPVMDGYETAKAIRALDRADAKTVPIAAMTADAFEEDIRHSREAGMNAHLTKPIDPEKLMETLREII